MLVPSVPTPMAGAIYILPPERVHPVDVPFTVALKVFSKWGTGAGEFVRAMRDQPGGKLDAKAVQQFGASESTPPGILQDLT